MERVTTDALIARLYALTDAEREDFLRLARDQPTDRRRPDGTSREVDRALNAWHEDGTTEQSWEFMFDPWFPDSGWNAWFAAHALVREVEDALESGDEAAIARLAPALRQLGLATGDVSG